MGEVEFPGVSGLDLHVVHGEHRLPEPTQRRPIEYAFHLRKEEFLLLFGMQLDHVAERADRARKLVSVERCPEHTLERFHDLCMTRAAELNQLFFA